MGNVVGLIGPSASGKGSLRKFMTSTLGRHAVIACSTRVPRDQDGADMVAGLTSEAFSSHERAGRVVLCHSPYGQDRYGLWRASLQCVVATPSGGHTELAVSLLESCRGSGVDFRVVGVVASQKVVLQRQNERAGDVDAEARAAAVAAELQALFELAAAGKLDGVVTTNDGIDDSNEQLRQLLASWD